MDAGGVQPLRRGFSKVAQAQQFIGIHRGTPAWIAAILGCYVKTAKAEGEIGPARYPGTE
ncbi:hypothetical protein YSKK_32110 [Halopseudomonas aestusnigri]|nr:hypothetical protein YSKK_32110 [Halopseudomonas aestusnigri]